MRQSKEFNMKFCIIFFILFCFIQEKNFSTLISTMPCDICIDNCESCLNSGNFKTNLKPGRYDNCPNFCSSCFIDKNNYLMCDSCLSGFYKKNFSCQKCSKECKSCTGTEDNCDLCANGFYFLEDKNKCVSLPCPDAYYPVTSTKPNIIEIYSIKIKERNILNCRKCDIKCSKCINNNKCVECAKGYRQYTSKVKLIPGGGDADNNFNFIQKNSLKLNKSKNTKKLYDDEDKQLKIIENLIPVKIKEFECVKDLICEDGKYYDYFNESCEPCDKSCKKCIDDNKNCLICQDNFIKFSNTNNCINLKNHPNNLFLNKVKNIFEKCSENCKQCENETKCNTCEKGFYLDQNFKCKKCDDKCETCDMNPLNCLTCKESFFKMENEDKCLEKCPSEKYYEDIDKNNMKFCKKCSRYCLTCSSFDKCTSCIQGLTLFKNDNKCKLVCENGFYPSYENSDKEINYQCNKCDNSCEICENDKFNCKKCKNKFYTTENYWNQDFFKCLDKCPIGHYLGYKDEIIVEKKILEIKNDTNETEIQKKKLATMFIQKVSIRKSIAKNESKKKLNLILTKNKNLMKKSLENCDKNILNKKITLNKNILKNLLLLQTNLKKLKNFSLSKKSKIKKINLFQSIREEICRKCTEFCDECKYPGDECLKCQKNFFLLKPEMLCINNCQTEKGFFLDSKDNTCNRCDVSCKTCKGNSKNCIDCNEDYFKFEKNVPLNSSERISDSTVPAVKDIKINPNNYLNENFTIDYSYILQNINTIEFCVNKNILLKGYFLNPKKKLFSICHNSCLECSNDYAECIKCNVGYFNLVDDLKKTKCFEYCPKGYYLNQETNICEFCSKSCSECFETPHNCLNCADGFYKINDTNKCLNLSKYEELIGKFIKKYNPKTFNNIISNGDISNKNTTKTDSTTIMITIKHKKKSSVEIEDYFFDKLSNTFKPCAAFCNGCKNSESNCIYCNEGYSRSLLDPTKCVKACKTGFYMTIFGCLKCDDSCSECEINDKNCQKCNDEYFMLFKKNQLNQNIFDCVLNCPKNYFPDYKNKMCLICDKSCLECNFSSDHCLKCNIEDGFLPLEDNQFSCKKDTPMGYFKDIPNNKQSKCPENCKNCINKDKCIQCKNESLIKFFPFNELTNYFTKDNISKVTISDENYYKFFDYVLKFNLNENSQCISKCPTGNFDNSYIKCLKFYNSINSVTNNLINKNLNNIQNEIKPEETEIFHGKFKNYFSVISNTKCSQINPLDSKHDNVYLPQLFSEDQNLKNFSDGIIYQKFCSKCDVSCKECTGNKNFCIECNYDKGYIPIVNLDDNELKIYKNKFHDKFFNNNCVLKDSCPEGFYLLDITNQKIDEKKPTDLLPIENSNSKIQLYIRERFGQEQINDLLSIKNKKCDVCAESCLKCEQFKHKCLECNKGYFPLEDDSSKCYAICPKGYYLHQFENESICIKCDSSCSSCDSPAPKCISCNQGFRNSILDKRLCVTEACIDGFYFDSILKECKKCNEKCLLCMGKADTCITCNYLKGFFEVEKPKLNNYFDFKEKNKIFVDCLDKDSTSPLGLFMNIHDKKFSLCDKKCLECKENEFNCSKCNNKNGFYLLKYSERLLTNKSLSHLKFNNSDLICKSFNELRQIIKDLNNINLKEKISIQFFLKNNKLYGSSLDEDYYEIDLCDDMCIGCVDTSTNCFECNNSKGYFKIEELSNIDNKNPLNLKCKLKESENNKNIPENISNQTNSNSNIAEKPTVGITIKPGVLGARIIRLNNNVETKNNLENSNSLQTINIPNNQTISINVPEDRKITKNYEVKENLKNETIKCHESCLTCTTFDHCIDCNKNAKFYPKKDNSSECLKTSPEGYYLDKKRESFIKCFEGCKICIEEFDNCIGCNLKNNYYPLIDKMNTCTKYCPKGYKFDSDRGICDIENLVIEIKNSTSRNLATESSYSKLNILFTNIILFIIYWL